MRLVVFRYTAHGGHPAPIIPVAIQGMHGWTVVWTYVDSGASVSILRIGEAGRLGLNVEAGQLTYSVVGDGSLIPVYIHQLPIRIGQVGLIARIGFSPRLGVGFNLLGRQDIFTRFDVTFSDARRQVSFRPRPKPASR